MRYMSKSIITFLLDIPWASVSKFGLSLLYARMVVWCCVELSEDMMIIGQTVDSSTFKALPDNVGS